MAAANTFAGAGLDRATERRRDRDWVRALLADPASRAVVAGEGGVLVTEGSPIRPALRPLTGGGEPVLLGCDAAGALFAVDGGDPALGVDAAGPGTRMAGLRDVAPELSQADGGLLAYAAAILHWHRVNRFCGRCGSPARVEEAGHLRVCTRCGQSTHPRTDPVVIMLVTGGDRALLGRQARWPPGRYSALAGFVEPGESLEEAVAREVREETGVTVARPRYRSSQPWPFPASLMLGFFAERAGGEPAPGDGELEDARWFDRDELRAAAEGRGPIALAPRDAIARRLIDAWVAEGPG